MMIPRGSTTKKASGDRRRVWTCWGHVVSVNKQVVWFLEPADWRGGTVAPSAVCGGSECSSPMYRYIHYENNCSLVVV